MSRREPFPLVGTDLDFGLIDEEAEAKPVALPAWVDLDSFQIAGLSLVHVGNVNKFIAGAAASLVVEFAIKPLAAASNVTVFALSANGLDENLCACILPGLMRQSHTSYC